MPTTVVYIHSSWVHNIVGNGPPARPPRCARDPPPWSARDPPTRSARIASLPHKIGTSPPPRWSARDTPFTRSALVVVVIISVAQVIVILCLQTVWVNIIYALNMIYVCTVLNHTHPIGLYDLRPTIQFWYKKYTLVSSHTFMYTP